MCRRSGTIPDFELVATASTSDTRIEGVPHAFRTHRDMLAGVPDLDAVAICTPPSTRHAIASDVLQAGKHALLEKPPAASVGALTDLARIAEETGRVLFTTWHSQYNAAVDAAADALLGDAIRRLRIEWKEDVRVWHPGATWMWDAAGFGVFDPGINALSILTRIAPHPVFVTAADSVGPRQQADPDPGRTHARDRPGHARGSDGVLRLGPYRRRELDHRRSRRNPGVALIWKRAATGCGSTARSSSEAPSEEYPAIYRHFATLLREGRSHIDDAPFRLVADAFMLGRRSSVAAFED